MRKVSVVVKSLFRIFRRVKTKEIYFQLYIFFFVIVIMVTELGDPDAEFQRINVDIF